MSYAIQRAARVTTRVVRASVVRATAASFHTCSQRLTTPPTTDLVSTYLNTGVNLSPNMLKRRVGKTAMEYINEVPVIVVDGPRAICDGGNAAGGHPIEYIPLNKRRRHQPETCKYCGLRYVWGHQLEHQQDKE